MLCPSNGGLVLPLPHSKRKWEGISCQHLSSISHFKWQRACSAHNHPLLAQNVSWRAYSAKGKSFPVMERVSPSLSHLFEFIGRDEEGRPSPSCQWVLFYMMRGETLPVVSVWLIWCDEEGRPFLLYLFDFIWHEEGRDPLYRVYGFYSTQWWGKPSLSCLFDLIWCNKEQKPSLSHLFDIIQCDKRGKPSCHIYNLI